MTSIRLHRLNDTVLIVGCIYSYIIAGDGLIPIQGNNTDIIAGGTWQETVKLANIYEDGFIGTDGDFIIRTGDTGKITIKLYCPFEMTGEEWYRIFVNGQEIVWARAVSGGGTSH